jgi:membrane protease YdiL (CAAX protease family)
MNLLGLFFDPRTQRLRSGWRVLIFLLLVLLPRLATLFIPTKVEPAQASSYFEVDGSMVIVYVALILWVALISWFCLRFLEGLRFASLGYAFHSGWLRDLSQGIGLSAVMIVLVVLIQLGAGGSRIQLNSEWPQSPHLITSIWRALLSGFGLATLLLLVAASFEEIVFRGFVFQTLLRDVPAAVPILLLSLLFGLAHWSNPSRTLFSTTNTILAGIWLAVAYLKTRSLWLPTGLHFGWNWMMGLFFGIPVSGLPLRDSLLVTTSGSPYWLTGGGYGSEGGFSATLILGLAILVIWRAPWWRISPEMAAANLRPPHLSEVPLQLELP